MGEIKLYNFMFANLMAYKKPELAYIYLRDSYTFFARLRKIKITILSSKAGKNSALKTGKVIYLTANIDEDFRATITE